MEHPNSLPLSFLHDTFISRTDNLIHAYQFLDAMGRPANDPGNGKHGCVQFLGDAQHIVDESTVKIHIGADTLVDPAILGDYDWRQFFYILIKQQIFFTAFLYRKPFHIAPEDPFSGIRQRIDRMTHSVD